MSVMRKPREDYTEVFPDNGDNDMFEVMKLLVQEQLQAPDLPRASARAGDRQAAAQGHQPHGRLGL